MAVRSLTEIWVDANFKETQLRDLRIGQPVDLNVDMYGGKHVFKGRISGFTEGYGSTLALLPPENATGNFIKVVQRLPVRIDLVDYNADQAPLFIGTSVVPDVYINKQPTGPDAGKFLQTYVPQSPASGPTASTSGAAPSSSATSSAATSSTATSNWAMSGAVASPAVPVARSRPAINPWIIAAVVWCRHSWKCWTPRSLSWRCAISPAGCRPRSMTASG